MSGDTRLKRTVEPDQTHTLRNGDRGAGGRDRVHQMLPGIPGAITAESCVGVGWLVSSGDTNFAEVAAPQQCMVIDIVEREIARAERREDAAGDALEHPTIAAGTVAAGHLGGEAEV